MVLTYMVVGTEYQKIRETLNLNKSREDILVRILDPLYGSHLEF